jgi:hypothetical protein
MGQRDLIRSLLIRKGIPQVSIDSADCRYDSVPNSFIL